MWDDVYATSLPGAFSLVWNPKLFSESVAMFVNFLKSISFPQERHIIFLTIYKATSRRVCPDMPSSMLICGPSWDRRLWILHWDTFQPDGHYDSKPTGCMSCLRTLLFKLCLIYVTKLKDILCRDWIHMETGSQGRCKSGHFSIWSNIIWNSNWSDFMSFSPLVIILVWCTIFLINLRSFTKLSPLFKYS